MEFMVEPTGPGPRRRIVGWVAVAGFALAPLLSACGGFAADVASDAADDDVEVGLQAAGGKDACRTADGSLDSLPPETLQLDHVWAFSAQVEDWDAAPAVLPALPPGPQRGPPTLV